MKKRTKDKTSIKMMVSSLLILTFFMTLACNPGSMDSAIEGSQGVTSELTPDNDSRVETQKIVERPDVMPEPAEGLSDFLEYIGGAIKYPENAKESGIEGKVFVGFVVSKEGSISHIEIEKGLGYGLDEEAARVIKSYQKKWKPGVKNGQPVPTRLVIPITYALNESK